MSEAAERSINVRVKRDYGTCWITGVAALSNNRLVLADYHNNRVKLVYSYSGKILHELSKFGRLGPFDVATIDKDQVAVTIPCSNKITFLRVTHKLKQEREISTKGECTGLAHSQGRLVVVVSEGGTYSDKSKRLEIVDLDGNVMGKIDLDKSLFYHPQYVTCSRDGSAIYLADCYMQTITCFTFDGTVLHVYKNDNEDWPKGLCTDEQGNVYTTGYCSSNVFKLSADLRECKDILTVSEAAHDRCTKLWAICYQQDTASLVTTLCRGNIIKVFPLDQSQ